MKRDAILTAIQRGDTGAEVNRWIRVDGVDMPGTCTRRHDGKESDASANFEHAIAWFDGGSQRARVGCRPPLVGNHPQVIAQAVHGRSRNSPSARRPK